MLLDLDILTQKRRHIDLKMGLQNCPWDLEGDQSIGYGALQTTFWKDIFWFEEHFVRNNEREPPMGNVIAQALTLTSHG